MSEPLVVCEHCGKMHGKWSSCEDMINQWHLNDKAVLAQALKDIYAIRGEDAEIAAIVLKALREGCVPGY